MAQNIAENFNRLNRVHDNVTDRPTDKRQTDGRTTTYSERVRSRSLKLLIGPIRSVLILVLKSAHLEQWNDYAHITYLYFQIFTSWAVLEF